MPRGLSTMGIVDDGGIESPPFDYPEADHVDDVVLGGSAEQVTKPKRRGPSSAEQGQRAYERKLALLRILAPNRRCQKCGKRPRLRNLQIHHVDGRDWEPRKLNRWARVARYEREHRAGVRLQALCIQCNAGINPKADAKTAMNVLNKSTAQLRQPRQQRMKVIIDVAPAPA